MGQQECVFETEITKTFRLNYLLFLPQSYGQRPEKKWPLILFLHGRGEQGDDLQLVKKHGIPKIVETREGFPFITLSPQCPIDSSWQVQLDALNALLDEVVDRYAADAERIYLTGLSMGGYGTWQLACAFPERFAAIAPICGGRWGAGGFPQRLKHIPAWAFHGAKDEVVSVKESKRPVAALKAIGGDARLTVYAGAEHDSWTRTYANADLYRWFLQHARGAPPAGQGTT